MYAIKERDTEGAITYPVHSRYLLTDKDDKFYDLVISHSKTTNPLDLINLATVVTTTSGKMFIRKNSNGDTAFDIIGGVLDQTELTESVKEKIAKLIGFNCFSKMICCCVDGNVTDDFLRTRLKDHIKNSTACKLSEWCDLLDIQHFHTVVGDRLSPQVILMVSLDDVSHDVYQNFVKTYTSWLAIEKFGYRLYDKPNDSCDSKIIKEGKVFYDDDFHQNGLFADVGIKVGLNGEKVIPEIP